MSDGTNGSFERGSDAPERATLWMVVCRARCARAPAGLDRDLQIDGRYLRQFSTPGNNIAIFTTDKDREWRSRRARVV